MNWLAHLHLARDEPAHRIGNLLGDFLQGVESAQIPAEWREGLAMHREVDRFTDAHPTVRRAAARLVATDPRLTRVAGVLLDIWFDHLLARHWADAHPGQGLREFTASCYRDALAELPRMPGRLARILPQMAREDWLASYRDPAQLRPVLTGMAARRRRPLPLVEGFAALQANRDALTRDFLAYLPDLQQRFAPHRLRPR